MSIQWTVMLSGQVTKQLDCLPLGVRKNLIARMREIEISGNWPNYGPLGKDRHHCHLKKGRPTYVAVWEVVDKAIKIIEVTYAGTHERAPY